MEHPIQLQIEKLPEARRLATRDKLQALVAQGRCPRFYRHAAGSLDTDSESSVPQGRGRWQVAGGARSSAKRAPKQSRRAGEPGTAAPCPLLRRPHQPRRRATQPMAPKPASISRPTDGSGTAAATVATLTPKSSGAGLS